jgi:preprotein translocase subunit SecD
MSLLARTRFYGGGHRLSGLDPAHLGVKWLPGARTRRGAAVRPANRGAEA